MSTAPARPGSAAAQRLAMRLRSDLSILAQSYGARRYYLVKDPVGLRYFHLGEEEHAIARMLDGTTSLLEIKRRFELAFAPQQVTLEQLHTFVGHLHQLGLLVVESAGQGEELLQRRHRRRRREWAETLGNVLAIRFRGIDPERLLRWLAPRCAWLFSFWFLAAGLGMVVSAAILAAVQFDVLTQRLSASAAFFTAGNLVWLAVAVAVAKTLHELGHALACKHFGGECNEIGLLLLVFTPCLYCNVSDVWLLPSKWQRMAVAGAGILVEIILASLCVFLWWFSEPGLLNTLFLSIIVVCSVNTLFFNGNPLLRYDGYYVLADWLEIPNLSAQARALVNRGLQRLFFGWQRPAERYIPERLRLLVATYGIASLVYRWLAVVAILWGGYQFLRPYDLQILAEGLAVLAIAGMLALPFVRMAAALANPVVRQQLPPSRLAWGLLACAALGLLVALLPLPLRVSTPAILRLQEGRDVYVVVPGRLVQSVAPGQPIAENQEVARLVNLQIAKETAEWIGQRDQHRARLQNLRLRLAEDPTVAPQIPSAEAALADMESRLRQRQRDEEQLVLRAPVAGTVVPAPRRPTEPYHPGALRTWHGGLLEPQNRGAYLDTGTLVCTVGDPARLEAVLVIDQADINLVRPGQLVRIKLAQLPGVVLAGTLTEVARRDLKVAPRELAAQGSLPVHFDRAGVPHPATVCYEARVALTDNPPDLIVAACGQAKILADPQSLGARLYHRLWQVFRFAL